MNTQADENPINRKTQIGKAKSMCARLTHRSRPIVSGDNSHYQPYFSVLMPVLSQKQGNKP